MGRDFPLAAVLYTKYIIGNEFSTPDHGLGVLADRC
jgi:hypothetical protein